MILSIDGIEKFEALSDAFGMLGTIATGVVIDAYGPIYDNAGCIVDVDVTGKTHDHNGLFARRPLEITTSAFVRIKQALMDGGVQILHRPPKALN
ncbi:hypothetical protein Tco_0415011 [Tanacetum coccineum]